VGRCAFFLLLVLSASGTDTVPQNGDALSKIYVGTGAINSSFTRSGKRNLAGLLSDASKRCAISGARYRHAG
jgi:hypothetical protein